jgi:hypothetical protein
VIATIQGFTCKRRTLATGAGRVAAAILSCSLEKFETKRSLSQSDSQEKRPIRLFYFRQQV